MTPSTEAHESTAAPPVSQHEVLVPVEAMVHPDGSVLQSPESRPAVSNHDGFHVEQHSHDNQKGGARDGGWRGGGTRVLTTPSPES